MNLTKTQWYEHVYTLKKIYFGGTKLLKPEMDPIFISILQNK